MSVLGLLIFGSSHTRRDSNPGHPLAQRPDIEKAFGFIRPQRTECWNPKTSCWRYFGCWGRCRSQNREPQEYIRNSMGQYLSGSLFCSYRILGSPCLRSPIHFFISAPPRRFVNMWAQMKMQRNVACQYIIKR